jgi:hypothetical protein
MLLHFGEALPRLHEQHGFLQQADTGLEARFVDLQKRLLTAAVYPRPVFGLGDFVREGLRRDPMRAGHAGAAAMWAAMPDGEARWREKLRVDLIDLAALKAAVLEAAPTQVAGTQGAGVVA